MKNTHRFFSRMTAPPPHGSPLRTLAELRAFQREHGYSLWQLAANNTNDSAVVSLAVGWRIGVEARDGPALAGTYVPLSCAEALVSLRHLCPTPEAKAILNAAHSGRLSATTCVLAMEPAAACGAAHDVAAEAKAAAATLDTEFFSAVDRSRLAAHYTVRVVPRRSLPWVNTLAELNARYGTFVVAIMRSMRDAPQEEAAFVERCAALRYDPELAVTAECLKNDVLNACAQSGRASIPAGSDVTLRLEPLIAEYYMRKKYGAAWRATMQGVNKPPPPPPLDFGISPFSVYDQLDARMLDALADANTIAQTLAELSVDMHADAPTSHCVFSLTAGLPYAIRALSWLAAAVSDPGATSASDGTTSYSLLKTHTLLPAHQRLDGALPSSGGGNAPCIWAPHLAPGSAPCDRAACRAAAFDVATLAFRPASMLCAGCRRTVYCSVECQTLDWPAHRAVCANVKRSR